MSIQSEESRGAGSTHHHVLRRSASGPLTRWVVWGVLLVAGMAARASALTIDGGPVYAGTASTPVSGAVCTFSGTPCATGGATVTCTGLPTGAILYYGIKTNSFVEGDTEVLTTGPVATSAAVFRFSST